MALPALGRSQMLQKGFRKRNYKVVFVPLIARSAVTLLLFRELVGKLKPGCLASSFLS